MGALFDAELKIDAVMFGGSGRKRMREKKPEKGMRDEVISIRISTF